MEISKIYKKYEIRKLEEKDIEKILLICNSNPQYYEYDPPFASFESIKMDMKATPPDIRIERKYYLGFFENRRLIAILDLILEYPDSTTVYIGFFMIHNQYSKKGVGSKIISSLSTYILDISITLFLTYLQIYSSLPFFSLSKLKESNKSSFNFLLLCYLFLILKLNHLLLCIHFSFNSIII